MLVQRIKRWMSRVKRGRSAMMMRLKRGSFKSGRGFAELEITSLQQARGAIWAQSQGGRRLNWLPNKLQHHCPSSTAPPPHPPTQQRCGPHTSSSLPHPMELASCRCLLGSGVFPRPHKEARDPYQQKLSCSARAQLVMDGWDKTQPNGRTATAAPRDKLIRDPFTTSCGATH